MIKNKKNIAIIYGGPSNEHNVSLASARNILGNINRNKYKIIEIFIDKEGVFFLANNFKKVNKKGFNEKEFIRVLKDSKIKKVLPILHGNYGESGELQKLLEKNKIDFVGSGSKSSFLAMNKNKSNKVFVKNSLCIPRSKVINKVDLICFDKDIDNIKDKIVNSNYSLEYLSKVLKSFSFPLIIKPVDEGSSLSVYKIKDQKELIKKLAKIFSKNDSMMLQECIEGREFTCGIIEKYNKKENIKIGTPLIPSEIVLTETKIFDYKAKYIKDKCLEITPANIDNKLKRQIQDTALVCHKILGCKDVSRTDIILNKKDNKIYVLETNTLPGMTETSFVPAQAKAEGIDIAKLIDILLF